MPLRTPSLTIAICTFNRSRFLRLCIDSLLPQVMPHGNITILVINNNSTDDTAKVLTEYQNRFAFVRAIGCSEQGLSYARNAAVTHSEAEWLSFIDDDAYASPTWVNRTLEVIDSAKYDAFGGIYIPWFLDGKKAWFLNHYESNQCWMPSVMEKQLMPGDPYFSGGNCCFKVSALKSTLGFNEALGMSGNNQAYGEEVELQRNLALKGFKLGFVRDLTIHHYTPKHKQSVFWAAKRAYITGRDFWRIYAKDPTSKNVAFYTKSRVKLSVKAVYASLKRDILTTNPSLTRFGYECTVVLGVLGLLIGAVMPKSRS